MLAEVVVTSFTAMVKVSVNSAVLSDFTEAGHVYKKGDSYPTEGVKVTQERLEYLSDATKNRAVAFIEKVAEKKDKRYDKYNVEALKKLLTDAGVEHIVTENKPALFALALQNELI